MSVVLTTPLLTLLPTSRRPSLRKPPPRCRLPRPTCSGRAQGRVNLHAPQCIHGRERKAPTCPSTAARHQSQSGSPAPSLYQFRQQCDQVAQITVRYATLPAFTVLDRLSNVSMLLCQVRSLCVFNPQETQIDAAIQSPSQRFNCLFDDRVTSNRIYRDVVADAGVQNGIDFKNTVRDSRQLSTRPDPFNALSIASPSLAPEFWHRCMLLPLSPVGLRLRLRSAMHTTSFRLLLARTLPSAVEVACPGCVF